MKYFSLFIFLLMISACTSSEDSPSCKEWEYDSEFKLSIGDSVCFPDGNSFEVKTIRDQFCCCLCICIWEGELEVMVETTDNLGKKDLFTFGSSSYIQSDEIFPGYVVSSFYYLYNDEPDSLPLCEGAFDAERVDLVLTISKK